MLDLYHQMLRAQEKYVAQRIENEKDRDKFIWQMENFFNLTTNIGSIREHIKETKENLKYDSLSIMGYFFHNKKYEILACNVCLDICDSIETRFVKGGERTYDLSLVFHKQL